MWGDTSSIGSGEAELMYCNGGLSFFLCPFDFVLLPFDISSALHEGRRLRAFLWESLMKFLRGGNLGECSGFRVRGLAVSPLVVILLSSVGEVSGRGSCALIANSRLLWLLGLKIDSLVASCVGAACIAFSLISASGSVKLLHFGSASCISLWS
ncbi:hypothetical protein YC2023_095061 [Brassica napus]